MTSFISKNTEVKMPKIKFSEKYFYCPIFKNKNDYENRMSTDLAADIFNEIDYTTSSYAKYDAGVCLYVFFAMQLAFKIVKIDNKAYRWLIDSAIIEAKNDLKDVLRYKNEKRGMKKQTR